MKVNWLPLCLSVLAILPEDTLAHRQEQPRHAPTMEVCRADAAVWWNDFIVKQYNDSENELSSSGKYRRNPVGDLSLNEIRQRMHEMIDCQNVDERELRTYSYAWAFYDGVLTERYFRFIERHGLTDQLMKEDAKGLR